MSQRQIMTITFAILILFSLNACKQNPYMPNASYIFMSPMSPENYKVDPKVRSENGLATIDTSHVDGRAVSGTPQTEIRNRWVQLPRPGQPARSPGETLGNTMIAENVPPPPPAPQDGQPSFFVAQHQPPQVASQAVPPYPLERSFEPTSYREPTASHNPLAVNAPLEPVMMYSHPNQMPDPGYFGPFALAPPTNAPQNPHQNQPVVEPQAVPYNSPANVGPNNTVPAQPVPPYFRIDEEVPLDHPIYNRSTGTSLSEHQIVYRGAAPTEKRTLTNRKKARNLNPEPKIKLVQFEDFELSVPQNENATFPPETELSFDFAVDDTNADPALQETQQWETPEGVPAIVSDSTFEFDETPELSPDQQHVAPPVKQPGVVRIAAIRRLGQMTMQSKDLSDELQIEPELAEKHLDPSLLQHNADSVPRLEYLFDGGDAYPKAGVRTNQLLKGLSPEDTVVVYESSEGQQFVHPSNRFPLYSPRFGSVRIVEGLSINEQKQLATASNQSVRLITGQANIPVGKTEQELAARYTRGRTEIEAVRTRQQGSQMLGNNSADEYKQTSQAAGFSSILVHKELSSKMMPHLARGRQNAICWSGAEGVLVRVGEIPLKEMIGINKPQTVFQVDDGISVKEIRFIKVADRDAAVTGEIVEFTLRIENVGNEELQNVTLFDSLTARMEFLPESAKSSLPASFHVEPNETGSVILRWELKESLQPRQHGVIVFKCRVR